MAPPWVMTRLRAMVPLRLILLQVMTPLRAAIRAGRAATMRHAVTMPGAPTMAAGHAVRIPVMQLVPAAIPVGAVQGMTTAIAMTATRTEAGKTPQAWPLPAWPPTKTMTRRRTATATETTEKPITTAGTAQATAPGRSARPDQASQAGAPRFPPRSTSSSR
jgi:hypothetical protein